MSKDNVLKKQFTKKEVTRLRNIVKGKAGDKTTTSVGYSKKEEFHKEGDVWEEKGKTWTIKDGIKKNITKLKKARKLGIAPLFCPECNKVMKQQLDKSFYFLHKKCHTCVSQFETRLKAEGKWEEYQNSIHNNEIDNKIKDFKTYIEEKLSESNNTYVSENGEVEKWLGEVDVDRVENYVKEVIEYLESQKR